MSIFDVVKQITEEEALGLIDCVYDKSLNRNETAVILENNFLTVAKALAYIGNLRNYNSMNKFLDIAKEKIINVYSIPEYEKEQLFLLKREIDIFLQKHISLAEALEKYELKDRNYFTAKNKFERERGRTEPFSILRINSQREGVFLNRKQVENHMREKEDKRNRYYSQREAMKMLDLTQGGLIKVLEDYAINPTIYGKLLKDDIHHLMKEQERILKDIEENYYPSKTLMELANVTKLTMATKNIKGKRIPPIARTNNGKYPLGDTDVGTSLLYEKKLVDDWILQRKVNQYRFDTPSTDPFVTFKGVVEISGINFSERSKVTEELWFKYVRKKFSKMNGSPYNVRSRSSILLGCTNIIISNIQENELFQKTENELNLSIFNAKYPKMQKREVYSFLKELNKIAIKHNQVPYWNIRKIKNPFREKINPRAKTVYSVEEYLDLTSYVNNIDLHLRNSIKDIKNIGIRKQNYIHYASVWLYVLVHLNNGWRHFDVLNIPRITLNQTSLKGKDLDWLIDNPLKEADIENIISQMKAKKLTHSKTKKLRYFFCSNELRKAFAYAIAICELRSLEYQPLSNNLIDYSSINFPNERHHSVFFKEYRDNSFKFKSLKMNRTVLSYIYTVVKDITNRNPLEFTKMLRNHQEEEVTSIYIDIPQEYTNRITKSLFDLGNFGYAYTALKELLGLNVSDKVEVGLLNTETSLPVKSVFGSISNVEKIGSYISFLAKKNNDKNRVRNYLGELSLEEMENIYERINLGMQPGKQEYTNCIFEVCKFDNRECHICPYAIHHLYGLSVLGSRLKKKIEDFDRFLINSKTEGTKNKLINSLYEDLSLLSIAVERFGENTVSQFLHDTSLEELRNLWNKKKQVLVVEGEK